MNYNKRAFSFVEIIIVISIVALLAIIGLKSVNNQEEKTNNSKIVSDTQTLENSFLSYKQENGELPMPGGNNNFIKDDSSYAHSWDETTTFSVHGFLTNTVLPKKYLNYLPLDPYTGQFYAYAKTKTTNQYEIASIIWQDRVPYAKVVGNYSGEDGPYNLIREYNGPNFVNDQSIEFFPYNPNEMLLTATISSYSGSISINGSFSGILDKTLLTGDIIEVGTGSSAELFYSDGSRSILGDNAKSTKLELIDMSYKADNNLITRIKLALVSGTIWTKATKLNENSEFDIFTTDATAAVRGTIFGLSKSTNKTNISVEIGKLKVQKIDGNLSLTELKTGIKNNTLTGSDIDIMSDGIIEYIPGGGVNGGTYINVQQGTSPKGINITRHTGDRISPTIGTGIINRVLEDSTPIKNNGLKIKSITPTSTGTIIELKNNSSYSGVIIKVGNLETRCSLDNNTYKCYLSSINNNTDLKLCKNKGTHGEQECFETGIKIGSGTTITEEQTINLSSRNKFDLDDAVAAVDGYNGVGRSTACPTFKVYTGTENEECVANSLGDDWKIVAYAPYNVDGDYRMYTSTSSLETETVSLNTMPNSFLGTTNIFSSSYCNNSNCDNEASGTIDQTNYYFKKDKMFKWGDTKGVFLDNDDHDDKLKYNNLSSLNLGNNFAIEMSVRGKALKRNNTTNYFLFNSDNYKLKFFNSGNLQLMELSNNKGTKLVNSGSLSDNVFYKVIFSKESGTGKLNIISSNGDIKFNYFTGSLTNSYNIGSNIYIGSSSSSNSQWNDIIDYIKIYKK